MAYRFTDPKDYSRNTYHRTASFDSHPPAVVSNTALQMAVASSVLDSIDFTGIVNNACIWDAKQTKIPPGECVKAMILAMMTDGKRVAIENIGPRFDDEPLDLYFDNVLSSDDLNPDALSRTLDKVYRADPESLFVSVYTALRMKFKITAADVHPVPGLESEYKRFDEDGWIGDTACRI